MNEREAFEDWLPDLVLLDRYIDDAGKERYVKATVELAWRAWQARAKLAEEEKAALVEAMREAYLSRSWVPVERVLARTESAEGEK